MKKYPILILALLFTLTCINAQDAKKEDAKDKIKNIKGDAEKIVIKTSEGEFVFEGNEAVEMLKKIKMQNNFKVLTGGGNKNLKELTESFTFTTDDDSDEKIIHISGTAGKLNKIGKKGMSFSISGDDKNDSKTVEVEKSKDGKTKITVVEKKDSKEVEKVYEGEEAENYLKENNVKTLSSSSIKSKIFISDDADADDNKIGLSIKKGKAKGDAKSYFIRYNKNDEDEDFEGETIKIIKKDGETKVTITSIENGKKIIKELSGKEANEYEKQLEIKGEKGAKVKTLIEKKIKKDK